ncbi:MAG: MFS transporter, partial [Cypionkella sp.]
MGPWLDILRRHRVVRASAAAIFLYGFAGAATSPYQSMIAIRELGMSDRGYAALALASSLAYVVMAIGVGMTSDRLQSYRRPLIFVSIFGILGYGLIWALPSVPTFALATLGPLALFHAMNSMLFGNVRAHSARFDAEEAQISNALMRIMISLSWVVMPGVVGLMLSGQRSMIAAYLIAALVAAGILLTVTFWLEPDAQPLPPLPEVMPDPLPDTLSETGLAPPPQPPARASYAALQDIRLILDHGLLARVLGVALISQMLHVNSVVLPLIV